MVAAPGTVFGDAARAALAEQLCHTPDDARPTWTLGRIIAHCAPCAGYTLSGCWRLLRRSGIRLRRGRPRLFSPDPGYREKREQVLAALRETAATAGCRIVLFLDEFTLSHWPPVGRTWWPATGTPPIAERAAPGERTCRIVAVLDAWTGRVVAHLDRAIGASVLAAFLEQVAAAFPDAEHITIVLDNWPVHHSPVVLEAVAALERVELLFLPTYSPWLNPIEKLWDVLKAELLRLHPYAGRWAELRQAVKRLLDRYDQPSADLRARVGLRGDGALAAALAGLTDFHRQN